MNLRQSAVFVLGFVLLFTTRLTFAGPPVVPVRIHADSQSDSDPAYKALDGDPNTFWHTRFGNGETQHPHELTVDLTRSHEISGVTYWPRSGAGNGTIKAYELYISDDHKSFGQPVVQGTFANDASEKHIQLSTKKLGRFVRLRALSEVKDQSWTSVAELQIHADGVQFICRGVTPWHPDAPPELERPRRTGVVPVNVTVDSQAFDAEGFLAMDGDTKTYWRTAWEPERRRHPHEITIDLGETSEVAGFVYTPCPGGGNGTIRDFEFYISDDGRDFGRAVSKGTFENNAATKRVELPMSMWGQFVKLRALSEVNGQPWTSIAELEILSEGIQFRATSPTAEEIAAMKKLDKRGHRPAGNSLQDILDLTLRTLAYVERSSSQSGLANELRSLERQIGQGADSGEMIKRLRDLRRRIVFTHPDLSFRQLLINKRPPPGYSHMCDQYLGRHSGAGPGLVVLENWKNNPRERILLKDKLPVGSVLHPDLSYDGQRVLFSFCDHSVEDTKQRRFLIYEASVDGRSVRQLTGTNKDPMRGWDGRQTVLIEDFDPCYLPDGGFAFVSTRSQTFGRCHGSRYVPTYMVFRGELDGTRIRQLSYGEANEWDPSVLSSGRIIYTRWDYINRHDVRFQSLWTMAPDGTGTAHFYGNYSSSPCMTAEAKAVPGSHKIITTTTAHHGYTAGSFIHVDPHVGQDGFEPLTWVTPEIRFPEAGDPVGGGSDGAFCNPWPLNENLCLAAGMSERLVGQGSVQGNNAYGIYLIDTLGGRELIYRVPDISSFSPIPIQPRRMPAVLPSRVAGKEHETTGTFYVQDVYEGIEPIEPGTIKSLRINRIIGQPTNGKPQLSLANNEIIKGIVGTVPVDRNGSVAFRAPAGVPLQIQALDEHGMAVMTMRSSLYLQPGEKAGCIGCHEQRGSTPVGAGALLDMTIHDPEPPVGPKYRDGFSFVRTVQPVLDRYCIECHGLKRKDAGLSLLGTPENGYSVAHNQLTAREGWVAIAYRNAETSYSKPKDYFAHAGRLATFLLHEHRKRVQLDRESFQRIVDWLDLNAQFYGDYSRNRDEDRHISSEGEKVLREQIQQTFGSELARQPLAALVNVAMPLESRILKAPLATAEGGWGQITPGGWSDTDAAGYVKLRRLVEATVTPRDSHDICGTCGRDRCGCGCCWVRRLREARDNPPIDFHCAPFPRDPSGKDELVDIPKASWKLVRADSEETIATDASAANAFDDDARTYWHTESTGDQAAHPHEIVIDLGRTYRVAGLRYRGRNGVGDVKDCEFFVSDDPNRFGRRVVKGAFTERTREQTVIFEAKRGRYVMLRALSSFDGGPYTSIRELSLLTLDQLTVARQ